MEECGTEALDALSRWPEGFAAVFDAAERIARGEADVEAFSSGAEPSEESEASLLDTSLDEVDEVELDRDAAAFVSAISHARSLDRDDVAHIRAALATAGLSRGFMLELAAKAGDDPAGILFASAVRRQAAARERMICSNLRLAYSVAKKYQWSTEALDDLVQEANIGLMKAVERFDWRRGSASPPTRCGGSASKSREQSPTRPEWFGFPFTCMKRPRKSVASARHSRPGKGVRSRRMKSPFERGFHLPKSDTC
ncbi:sigma factor [Azotobacter chroococcum]